MLNKIVLILSFVFLAITPAYSDSPEKSKSVPTDENSLQILIDNANNGDPNDQYNLGKVFADGNVVPQDFNEAFMWFEKAAEQGNTKAQYNLGRMYREGKGVPKDYNEAIKWYTKAAEQGKTYAQYSLGLMYYYGDDIPQDYNEAFKLFSKAAEQGDANAMYKIGFMYETGRSVDKDYEEARGWYKKASVLGDDEANIRLVVIFIKKYYKIALWGFLSVLIAGGAIYATEKKSDKNAHVFEIDRKKEEWSLWITIRRYAGALIIYLIYSIALWGPISQVVGTSLSPDKAKNQVDIGDIETIWEYGWGDHYIWFLIISCFIAYCCGVLAGATAKKKGALVAGIANLPIVILAIPVLFCSSFSKIIEYLHVENPIAWKIIYPLSILGFFIFSVLGGLKGVSWQTDEFDNSTILGIRPLHWSWLWVFSGFYVRGIAFALIPIITWGRDSDYGPSILQMLYLFIYGYPMYLMYQILSGAILKYKNKYIKIISFIGIYLGGIVAAILFDLIRFGLSKLISSIF
jgi:hypothetical protein